MPQVVYITHQFTLAHVCWYTGSAADGVGELESLQDNAVAQTVTGLVKAGADAAEKELEEEEKGEEKD